MENWNYAQTFALMANIEGGINHTQLDIVPGLDQYLVLREDTELGVVAFDHQAAEWKLLRGDLDANAVKNLGSAIEAKHTF